MALREAARARGVDIPYALKVIRTALFTVKLPRNKTVYKRRDYTKIIWDQFHTAVKLARNLHGARTISHDVIKITIWPCVKPQGQGELTFHMH